MEIRVPHYYRNFQCTADKCSDTCCAGWQIVIDEKTLGRYAGYEGSFGNRLRNSIDWGEGVFQQYEGRRCAFLNEKNLCDIYTEAGPDMFCKTCRLYPRHIEEFENVREISLSLSCPEAAKLVLDTDEPVRFLIKERECKEEVYDDFDFFLYSKLLDAREIMFHILQNRERPVGERAAMCLAFTHDLQSRIYRNDIAAMEDVFDRYTKDGAAERFKKHLVPYENDAEKANRFTAGMITQLEKLEVLRDSWPWLLKETKENIEDTELEQLWREDTGEISLEILTEQLLIYFLFTYFCGAVYDGEAHSKMKFSIIGTLTILETAKTLWKRKREAGKKAAVLEAAVRYSREVEHSDENIELLQKLSRREGVFGLANLLAAVLS